MRCNCGVNPKYLTDQWLIAEQVELLMIGGMLRKNNFEPKSEIPSSFKLGKGHMLFWVDKLIYLRNRHSEVKKEVIRRGFKATDQELILNDFPERFRNDWIPSLQDTQILRERLIWKIDNKPSIWRYKRKNIHCMINKFKSDLIESELYFV